MFFPRRASDVASTRRVPGDEGTETDRQNRCSLLAARFSLRVVRPLRICAQENRLPREALIAHLCTGELNVACQLALCLRLRCENRVKNPEE